MSTLAIRRPSLVPAAVAVMLFAVVSLSALAHLTAPPPAPAPDTGVLLSFSDAADGGVAVRSMPAGTLISTVPARSGGFLRMVLRLLAEARVRDNVGGQAPFRLTDEGGGRLQLSDPATGQVIELQAFGPSNIAEFQTLYAKVHAS
jgi:putative photosynthetic complex assembly protein